MKKIKKIGLLTSGGDAPGMNAALRAVVRSAINSKIEVIGFKNGYEGLIDFEFISLNSRSVGNIIQRGGSILHTSRSSRFLQKQFRQKAAETLKTLNIDGLVIIGGEGSTKGAQALSNDFGIKTVVIPATIDRDMPLIGPTIGFDTAINTALSAIDKIRDTATTANITHIVEVMGRNSGWLGILAGIGAGAEAAIIPEERVSIAQLAKQINDQLKKGKKGCILILAEGGYENGGDSLAKAFHKQGGLDVRLTTLGHVQRGGNPSAVDRVLASQLGIAAVNTLIENVNNVVVGKPRGEVIERISFSEIIKAKDPLKKDLYNIISILS